MTIELLIYVLMYFFLYVFVYVCKACILRYYEYSTRPRHPPNQPTDPDLIYTIYTNSRKQLRLRKALLNPATMAAMLSNRDVILALAVVLSTQVPMKVHLVERSHMAPRSPTPLNPFAPG